MPNIVMPNDILQSQLTKFCTSDERDADIIICGYNDRTMGAISTHTVELCAPKNQLHICILRFAMDLYIPGPSIISSITGITDISNLGIIKIHYIYIYNFSSYFKHRNTTIYICFQFVQKSTHTKQTVEMKTALNGNYILLIWIIRHIAQFLGIIEINNIYMYIIFLLHNHRHTTTI